MCERVRSILGEGAGWLGAGRCHDSDACRLGAGADSAEGRTRAACGAPGRAKHFKFGSGREVAREPGCGSAGRPEPAREGRVRGTVRGLTFWAGNAAAPAPPARKRRCGIARGRTSFASTDGQPRGWRCSGGRAGRRAGNEAAGGGPLADPSASFDTRTGWESALREEARDGSRTRLLHLVRGLAPGRRCGQVWQRGLVRHRGAAGRHWQLGNLKIMISGNASVSARLAP